MMKRDWQTLFDVSNGNVDDLFNFLSERFHNDYGVYKNWNDSVGVGYYNTGLDLNDSINVIQSFLQDHSDIKSVTIRGVDDYGYLYKCKVTKNYYHQLNPSWS